MGGNWSGGIWFGWEMLGWDLIRVGFDSGWIWSGGIWFGWEMIGCDFIWVGIYRVGIVRGLELNGSQNFKDFRKSLMFKFTINIFLFFQAFYKFLYSKFKKMYIKLFKYVNSVDHTYYIYIGLYFIKSFTIITFDSCLVRRSTRHNNFLVWLYSNTTIVNAADVLYKLQILKRNNSNVW